MLPAAMRQTARDEDPRDIGLILHAARMEVPPNMPIRLVSPYVQHIQ